MDVIACVTVNDPYVATAWGYYQNATNKVQWGVGDAVTGHPFTVYSGSGRSGRYVALAALASAGKRRADSLKVQWKNKDLFCENRVFGESYYVSCRSTRAAFQSVVTFTDLI